MDVLIVLVFVSLVFVAGAILLFLVSLHQRDFEHSDRLALLPILDGDPVIVAQSTVATGLAPAASRTSGVQPDTEPALAASDLHRP